MLGWQRAGPAAALLAALGLAAVETAAIAATAPHRVGSLGDLVACFGASYGVFACGLAVLLAAAHVGARFASTLSAWLLRRGVESRWAVALAVGAAAAAPLWWLLKLAWGFRLSPLRELPPVVRNGGSLVVAAALGAVAARFLPPLIARRRPLARIVAGAAALVLIATASAFNIAMLPYALDFLHWRVSAVLLVVGWLGASLWTPPRLLTRLRVPAMILLGPSVIGTALAFTPTNRATGTIRARGFTSRSLVELAYLARSPWGPPFRPAPWDSWQISGELSTSDPAVRPEATPPAPRRVRGVIWISIDALRVDDAHSEAHLPSFARFAREATDFRRAYSAYMATWFSLPAIATSQAFPPTRVRADAAATLASTLAAHGVATAAVFDFERYEAHFKEPRVYEHGFGRVEYDISVPKLDQLLASLSGEDRPFFLWVHSLGPHMPTLHWYDWRLATTAWRRPLQQHRLRSLVEPWLAALLATIERHEWSRDVAVMLFSDHGEGFGEHGRFWHGYAPYEEIARIPLAIRIPGQSPTAIHSVCSSLDLAPTTAALLGVASATTFEGRDLLRATEGASPSGLLLTNATRRHIHTANRVLQMATLDGAGRWKLHRNVPLGYLELYDLGDDPGERRNLAPERPDVLARMLRLEQSLVSRASQERQPRP
jgi:hypothetical protein